MQKKLSKHFIYKWLEEDSYGEYSLHHFNTKFSNQLLLNLWNFLSDTKRSQRGSLVLGLKSTRYLDFIASSLRYNLLLHAAAYSKYSPTVDPKSYRQAVVLKKHFSNFLFLNVDSIIIKSSFYKMSEFASKRPNRHYVQKKGNKVFLNTIKYSWRKCRRLQRTRVIEKFSNAVTAKRINSLISNGRDDVNLQKKIEVTNKFHFFFVKQFLKKFNFSFRRTSNFFDYERLWRYCFISNPTNNAKVIRPLPSTPTFKSPMLEEDYTNLNAVLLNLKNFVLSFTWDNFAYRLKQKIRKFTQFSKILKKTFLNSTYAKLKFKGTFQKKLVLVKKNEITRILSFRLLNYFNLLDTPRNLDSIFYNTYYKSKALQLPSPSILELHIAPALLRSGFFENGYVVNSMIKRSLFLLNGVLVKENVPLSVWDIVSLSGSVWWLVYARFINFFSSFVKLQGIASGAIFKSASFIHQFIKIKSLFKKFDYRSKLNTKGSLSSFVYSKNYIFSLPPAYMEVSYKMFIFVIYKLTNKSTDITIPFNRRGLKSILSTPSNRVFN